MVESGGGSMNNCSSVSAVVGNFRQEGYHYRVITRHLGTVIYTREADTDKLPPDAMLR